MSAVGAPVGVAPVTPPIRVLLADDEPHLGAVLERFLASRGLAVTVVRDGRAALAALEGDAFDVALLDVVMPEMDGLEVLRRARELPGPPEILVITGNGTVETSLAALRLGAYHVLSKPYRMAEIEAVVRRAWEKRVLRRDQRRWERMRRLLDPATPFLTDYAPLRAVLALLREGAPGVAPMLVTGAPGTGKRCLARQLHAWGDAPDGPVVEWVVAATRPEDQARALCGERRGEGPALLELAAGGMLVVHGVEALAPGVRALLREALARGEWTPVDGGRPLPLDLRLVGTSTRTAPPTEPLAGALWDALGVLRVALPPLADRVVDLPVLAEHFLARVAAGPPPQLTTAALEAMERYPWPGNVRELRAVLERGALLARGGVLDAALIPVPPSAVASPPPPPPPPGAAAPGEADPPDPPEALEALEALERGHIEAVLRATGWHQGRAARRLGISPKTLYRKIRLYGLVRPAPRRRGRAPGGEA